MSDIFISYASADRERAGQLAGVLQARGWSVWWDRIIPPGRQFDEVIDEALTAARCVVVLWSATSTASSWVKNEAADAMGRKALIPALLDADVKIPLEFRRLQAADLTQWHGEPSTPEFDQFIDATARVLAGPNPVPPPAPPPIPRPVPPRPTPEPAPAPAPAPTPAPAPSASRAKSLWIGVAVAAGVAIGIASLGNRAPDIAPSPSPAVSTSPSPQPVMPTGPAPTNGVAPINMNLQWRDYVLMFTGHLNWDGRSPSAEITASIKDGNTGQPLGNQRVTAAVGPAGAVGQGRYVFSTQVWVPGDSQTAGKHTHNVNLILQALPGGGWQFVQNCMTPNQCW